MRFDIRMQGESQTVFFALRPFEAIFVPADAADAVSDRAWLEAMLDAERALVNAGSLAGLVPADGRCTGRRGLRRRPVRPE